jgi:hypothetical protein
MAESQGDLEATSSVALRASGVFWAITQCIMYRRWHVRAILWRAVWEIDELAKDCIREVTEERGLINDDRLAWKQWSDGAGRHLGNGHEYSVFQVFGAPKKKYVNVCGRVTVERTRTVHTAERRLFHRTCVRSLEQNGWSGGHRVHRFRLVLGFLAGIKDRTTLQTA